MKKITFENTKWYKMFTPILPFKLGGKWYLSAKVGIPTIMDGDTDNPMSPELTLNYNRTYYFNRNNYLYVFLNPDIGGEKTNISAYLNSGNFVEYQDQYGAWQGDEWWELSGMPYPLQGTFIPRGFNKNARSNIVMTTGVVDGWESSTQFGVYTKTSSNTYTDAWNEFHVGFRVLTDGTNEYWEQDSNRETFYENFLEREKVYASVYGLSIWYDWDISKWIISNSKGSKPDSGYWTCDTLEGTYNYTIEEIPSKTISLSKYSEKNKDNEYGTYSRMKFAQVAVWL